MNQPSKGFPVSCLIFWLVLAAGCATVDDRYHGLDAESQYYRVKPGDTLYGIGKRVGKDYRLIGKWNNLDKPFRIVPGQVIRLSAPNQRTPVAGTTKAEIPHSKPKQRVARKTAEPPQKQPIRPKKESAKPVQQPDPRPNSVPAKKKSKKLLKVFWRWPLQGVIAKDFLQSGRKGLDIASKYGEPVRAAATGKIVYSGRGLIGYGNLVIVKHNAHFLSAYGNNSRLLVREGENVMIGQPIAEVGIGASKQAVLHFEIRKDGKPVDPIQHLPKP